MSAIESSSGYQNVGRSPIRWSRAAKQFIFTNLPRAYILSFAHHHTSEIPAPVHSAMAEGKRQKPGHQEFRQAEVTGLRPEVIVEFLFEDGLLFISVKNIGARPAVNVAVRFNQPLVGLNGAKDISALALFRNIEFLGPGREIVSLLDSSSSYFKRKQPTRVSASISYRDLEKRSYEMTIKHDLEIYRDLPFVSRSGKNDPWPG